jgi:negative regulator of flagellin synthesis FlgM
MIDGVGRTEQGRVALERASVERTASAPKVGEAARERPAPITSLAYEMLSAVAAPVDVQKVAALRVAIAEGRYPVDPQRIAQSMVALDLPTKPNA